MSADADVLFHFTHLIIQPQPENGNLTKICSHPFKIFSRWVENATGGISRHQQQQPASGRRLTKTQSGDHWRRKEGHWGYSGGTAGWRDLIITMFCSNLLTCLHIFTPPKYGQCWGCLHPACRSIARAHATARLCGPRLCRPAPAAPPRGPPRPAPAHPPRAGDTDGGQTADTESRRYSYLAGEMVISNHLYCPSRCVCCADIWAVCGVSRGRHMGRCRGGCGWCGAALAR